ncbi:hypothetical protein ACUL41_14395 [Virgibacillus natechei]|uniref:hypothetical protein n=1 Tax=Virgibacillus sp. CBA3643 TaxID=2942278 RepID=UPI0035A3CF17
MIKKVSYFVVLFISLLLILGACQGEEDSSQSERDVSHEESNQEATSETDSTDSEEATENNNNEEQQTESGESSNDEAASKEQHAESEDTSNSNIKETDYSNEQEAADAIENYEEIEETNTDLGHGVKALAEGATGHQYISWNEGKWLIRVNAPTDPEYATGNYENGEELARTVVDYLETNYLPAPDQCGVIEINDFSDHPGTVIRWQQGSTVYEIDEGTDTPIDALQIAVDHAS